MHRAILLASALLFVSTLPACEVQTSSDVKANVSCKGTSQTIDCNVTHKSGAVAANVCWDLKFTCQNGSIVTRDNICQVVQPAATAQRRIPISELKGFDKCDKAVSTEVLHLKLSKH